MSGMFGQVAPVQVPDFGASLARAQGIQSNRLAMLAQQRQLDQDTQLQNWFAQNGAAFAAQDPNQRMNLLAQLIAQPGGARMALPMMQALREEMEWSGAGQQAPAAAPQAAAAPAAGGDYVSRLVADESSGRADARNPRSTATGAAQFIDSTWLQFAQANPDLFRGMSREQILAARNNPDLSRRAAEWYRRENMTTLAGQGLPANDGTAALAHRFGPQGAAALLRADQNAPIDGVVGQQVMAANPDLAGRTVGEVVGRYAQRFGGSPDATPASARDSSSLPEVPGFDMARVRRAINLPNNAAAQRYLQSYMAAAGLMRRGETEPLERVRRPDGNEVLVPRSQAAGLVSAPAPRETPNPLGANAPGYASQVMRRLNQSVADGTASADDVALWRDAVEVWTQETRNPDGSIVPGRALSPEARRAADSLAQREGRAADAAAAPLPGDPPGPRTETTITGGQRQIRPQQVSPQDRERWAKIESDSGRVSDAIRGFREALNAAGGTGISAYFNNPQDPAAVRLNTAFSNLVTALRGEAFLNTGVLQPGEIALIDRMLLNPQSMRGLLSSGESYNAMLDEIQRFIERGLSRQRRVVLGQGYASPEGAAPDAPATPGPGGRGTASPPPAAPQGEQRTLRYNPRTGRIE